MVPERAQPVRAGHKGVARLMLVDGGPPLPHAASGGLFCQPTEDRPPVDFKPF